jgi:hypothetical protein
MAYQTGTASSIEDLMQQLHDFAVSNGWTSDVMSTTNDWMAINNGSVYVQFRWDNSDAFACFHSRGFINTSTAPGNHTGDDGCGLVDASAPYNASVSGGRRVYGIGNGPFTAYHFFTNGTTQYIHCVLEYTPGVFRHWSFGTIDKIGDWTGGEYCVAHGLVSTSLSGNNVLFSASSGTTAADANRCGSLHIEGMPNQSGGMQWMLFSTQSSAIGNDRAGNARITCPGSTLDYNPYLSAFGKMRANPLNGFLPIIPKPVFWRNTSPTPSQYLLLGFVPGMYMIQMANFNPGDEFTIGVDTFKVFPLIGKQTSSGSGSSLYCGVCYLKVT